MNRTLAILCMLALGGCTMNDRVQVDADPPLELEAFEQAVPSAMTAITMRPVTGGTATVETDGGPVTVAVESFWIASTEIPWEIYDVFVFARDPEADPARWLPSSRIMSKGPNSLLTAARKSGSAWLPIRT